MPKPMTQAWSGADLAAVVVAMAVATCLGWLISIHPEFMLALLIGAISLLPFFAHVRWVGVRRAIVEPSAPTIILIFYLFIFPMRGLAIALADYGNIDVARHSVTGVDLAVTLLLASAGTVAIVEGFHLVRTRRGVAKSSLRPSPPRRSAVSVAAGVMCGIALLAIFLFVNQKGGVAATQAEQLSHSKELALSGARSTALSLWAILAIPAVWAGSMVVLDRESPRFRRSIFLGLILVILVIQVTVFGSRLDALLSILGAWVIAYYSGRKISPSAVVVGVLFFIIVSVPILSQRPGGETPGASTVERYSRIAGYSVLDAALAARQEPNEIRTKLQEPSRWVDFPQYMVPSALRPGGASLESRRMDLYVAQSLGNQAQQTSGLPTTYITELWIYGGVLAVIVVSLAAGAALGGVHRRLVSSTNSRSSPSNLLWYCFTVTVAFTYFKDGDILTTAVGSVREATYLGAVLLLCGVWTPLATRRRRRSQAKEPAHRSEAASR